MKLKIWDKQESLFWANGAQATPEEVMTAYPFARNFPTVLQVSGGLVMAIDSLPMLADIYGIDEDLSDAEKLAAIRTAREEASGAAPSDPLKIRNAKLAESDWTQLPDAPLTEAQREAWQVYRQALRDLPEQPGWPDAMDWPTPPSD
jgi:hypothetical protein